MDNNLLVSIESAQFPGVYLRMDGEEVTQRKSSGSGLVNCQLGADRYEKFRLKEMEPDLYAIESVQFPWVFLRMDGEEVTQWKPFGSGLVNCQLGVRGDRHEMFRLKEMEPDLYAIESAQFPGVYLRMDGEEVTQRKSSGSGVVNCQLGADRYEKFRLNVLGTMNYQDDQFWCQPVLPGDVLEAMRTKDDPRKRAAMQKGVLWEKSDITYAITFSAYIINDHQEKIERERIIDEAFDEWNAVGMRISFRRISTWSNADIRIICNPKKSDWSMLGTRAKKVDKKHATMNLGMRKGLGDTGHVTALHEIGHAIGMVHEHQRIDSGIKWNKQGVYDYFANRRPIPVRDHRRIDNAVFGIEGDLEEMPYLFWSDWQYAYDPKSVMNYDFPASCFLEPEELARNGIQRSKHLTPTDKATALYFYREEARDDT